MQIAHVATLGLLDLFIYLHAASGLCFCWCLCMLPVCLFAQNLENY